MNREDAPTVVLGLDALSIKYVDRFDLPNIESLQERGVSASLRSTFSPWTGSAWPSMYTGVDPSHHGVYSFFDFSDGYPDEADLISRNDVRAPALWDYLSQEGTSSVVLNVLVTHPAESIDGALLPGYLAPEELEGHLVGVREDLSAALGEKYRIYATEETGDADEAMLESYVDLINLWGRAARTLVETYDPKMTLLQVQKTDTIFHQFDNVDVFRRVYEAADAFVGTVLDTVGIQPGEVYLTARRIGVDGPLKRLLFDSAGSIARHVDWTASAAYCRSGPKLGVLINLEGREREGVVPSGEYKPVRNREIQTLSDAHTSDGEQAFDWVRRREEIYDGPYTEEACDVLFKPTGMNHVVATNLLGKWFVPIDKHNHKMDGVFIGAGPGFEAGAAVERPSLMASLVPGRRSEEISPCGRVRHNRLPTA